MRVAFGILASVGVTAAMLVTGPPQSAVAVSMGTPRQVLLRPDSGNGDGEPEGKPHSGQKAMPELEEEVFVLTNKERKSAGCPALRHDDALHTAAENHSRDMAAYGYLNHTNQNNEGPEVRIERAGYSTQYGWAENIAAGPTTANAVMKMWMGSPAHRDNILNCKFKALGVGVAQASDGMLFWTQVFGGK
jgi:uncharacterized protein YkwD